MQKMSVRDAPRPKLPRVSEAAVSRRAGSIRRALHPARPPPHGSGPLRACFIGRMGPARQGTRHAREGRCSLLRDGRIRLDGNGKGRCSPQCVHRPGRHGSRALRAFHGWMARGAVQDVAAKCPALTCPFDPGNS
jgi:hypothetical protein